jgi:hypothetical protein
MATKDDKKDLWVGWTNDAVNVYELPDDIAEAELVDDAAGFAVEYADAMLEEYEARFEGGGVRRRKRKTKASRRVDPDEDED